MGFGLETSNTQGKVNFSSEDIPLLLVAKKVETVQLNEQGEATHTIFLDKPNVLECVAAFSLPEGMTGVSSPQMYTNPETGEKVAGNSLNIQGGKKNGTALVYHYLFQVGAEGTAFGQNEKYGFEILDEKGKVRLDSSRRMPILRSVKRVRLTSTYSGPSPSQIIGPRTVGSKQQAVMVFTPISFDFLDGETADQDIIMMSISFVGGSIQAQIVGIRLYMMGWGGGDYFQVSHTPHFGFIDVF